MSQKPLLVVAIVTVLFTWMVMHQPVRAEEKSRRPEQPFTGKVLKIWQVGQIASTLLVNPQIRQMGGRRFLVGDEVWISSSSDARGRFVQKAVPLEGTVWIRIDSITKFNEFESIAKMLHSLEKEDKLLQGSFPGVGGGFGGSGSAPSPK